MLTKQQQRRSEIIGEACEQAGCGEKETIKHHKLFVNHSWHVHPSPAFTEWWHSHPEAHNINVVDAWNCDRYHIQWRWCIVVPGLTATQATRIPEPRTTDPDILIRHTKWLVNRKRMKPDEVKGFLRDKGSECVDALRDYKDGVVTIDDVKSKLKECGVFDEPPTFEDRAAAIRHIRGVMAKPMPKAMPTDYDSTRKPQSYAKRDEEPIDF